MNAQAHEGTSARPCTYLRNEAYTSVRDHFLREEDASFSERSLATRLGRAPLRSFSATPGFLTINETAR